MCKYFSCIVKRDLEIVWDGNSSSHEDLIKKANLKDDKLEDRDFVRLELTPGENGFFTQKLKDWSFEVDEKGTLPQWYITNEKKIKEKVWKTCQESFKQYKTNLRAVGKFLQELPKIKWFSFSGKIKADWHMSFGINFSAADSAAYSAAYFAADSAADSAAYSAALFARCTLAKDLIDKKHYNYAKERMQIFRAGYGAVTDVKGKLYCYSVKKEKAKA